MPFFLGLRLTSLRVKRYIALSAGGTFGNHPYARVPLSRTESRENTAINDDPGETLCPIIPVSFPNQLVVLFLPVRTG